VTIVILILFGALAAMDAPRIEAQLPAPWVDVTERINVYGFMLWVNMPAIIFLRASNLPDSTGGTIANQKCKFIFK
jgi:hypothetical protein